MLRDLLLMAWFVMVAVAFWGPYLLPGVVPQPILTALYGLFFVVSTATLTLGVLRRSAKEDKQPEEKKRGK